MPPKRDPVPRVRTAPQWLGGLFVLGLIGAAVIGGGALLWENVDIQRMTASAVLREPHTAPPALLPDTPAHAANPLLATLYFSEESKDFFPAADYYSGLLQQWEQLISTAGGQVSRVSNAEGIDSLGVERVLVVPAAVCLSSAEVSAMRGFAERGGGVVLSWATGARDSTCKWIGWDGLTELTGIPDFNTLEQREAVYLTVPGGLPLSVGFAPATRVELRYESQVALATTGTRLYWSDWALNAEPVEDVVGMDAAAWLGRTDGGGRIVWFGFRFGHGASQRDEEYLTRLFRNGVWWAGGVPVAEIAPWPNGSQSAFLLTQDVESQFANSLSLARLAKEKAVPATFFVVSQLASEYPWIADSLAEAGEIGSHSSDHAVVADRSYVDQRARLSRSQDELRNWVGEPARGLRPPEERFDESTLRAWSWNGGSYIVGVNEARTGSPEVFETPDGKVVMLPRIIKNDYNVFVQDGAIRSRHLTAAFLAGMAKINALGALAVVSVRTQVGGEGNRIQVVAEVVDSARAKGDWWFAAGQEMADWWLARWESSLEVNYIDDGLLRISVRADASMGLNGAWLEVFLPGSTEDWTPRQRGSLMRHVRTEWSVRIPLSDIAAGEESVIDLTHLAPQLRTP